MSNDSGFEQYIIGLLDNCKDLMWHGSLYQEVKAFKPKPSSGECKTDIYISLRNDGKEEDSIKVTVKKDTAEFWGNKLTASAAEALLGSDWSNILKKSIDPIREKFLEREIFFLKPKVDSTDINFTLGWKLEVANKPRALSAPLILDKREIVDKVLKGTEQNENKKNILLNGHIIEGLGIADYLLEGNESTIVNAQSVLNSLIDLSTYLPPDIYLIFTGNNYRVMANKADGPRTLAVSISWDIQGKKIKPRFIFDQPLEYKGETNMMPIVQDSLEVIGIPRNTYLEKSINLKNLFEEVKESLILNQ